MGGTGVCFMRPGLIALCLCLLGSLAHAQMCPNVMLVIQGSSGMAADPMGGGNRPTKWDLVTSGVSINLGRQPRFRYGLEVFGGNCDEQIYFLPGSGSAAVISPRIQNYTPNGSTN